jgi:serine/threonine protein kinase/tetratricopeptide (TPR) repeat protein
VPISAGTRLGPYEILAPLGAGGMGEVYRARDARLKRDVAIKVLSGTFARDPERLARFQREAEVLATLNHPNIAAVYGLEESSVGSGIVLELVEGPTLADRIAQGPTPIDTLLPIAEQIVEAMIAAHEKGIIHRDLKPANIKVTLDGRVKLLDFGLAKLVQDTPADDMLTRMATTQPGMLLGTAAYMAPEQARGELTDARSDVFSFGAILYEALAGQRAFGGDSVLDTLNAVVHREPAPFDSPASGVVRRCLEKQPSLRFATMADVKAALQNLRMKRSEKTQGSPSIAVLPFANMSRDADDEYFSDGLAEEIINALVQMPGLKVIARTSAFAFKGKNEDIRRIADALGVTTLLEGSVRRAGSRIRVTAQLIQARDGTHLWSQRYDHEMADIFAMQDEIAAAIAGALKVKLAPGPERRTPSLPAYEAYLRYRSYQWKFTPEASQRSRDYLEQAIALDPEFALPYVGLADHYFALSTVGALPAAEAMPRARELAGRALAIDPDLPEAHAMLGIVAGHFDYDWNEAERRFRLATRHKLLSVHVRQWYASFYLLSVGRAEEARRLIERVIEEDPLCQIWYHLWSQVLRNLGLDEEALAASRKAVELDPQFWIGWFQLGVDYAIRNRHAEALPYAERAYAAAPWSPYSTGLMAGVFSNTGQPENAEPLLARLHDDPYRGPVGLCTYYLSCGDFDRAAEWAEKAADQRYPSSIIPSVFRTYEPVLRNRGAWLALMRKIRLA